MPKVVMKAMRFRIYPNGSQAQFINRTIGSCRFVFNQLLEAWNTSFETTGKGLSKYSCMKQLPALKVAYPFLKEADSVALQASLEDLADSFDRFFKKQNQKPVFKSRKRSRQSYTTKYSHNNICVVEVGGIRRLKLPKLGTIKVAWSRHLSEDVKIRRATISRRPNGAYYVSLLVEETVHALPKTKEVAGVDLGISRLATFSTGEWVENPRHLKQMEQKLTKAQRVLSRRIERAKKEGRLLRDAKNVQKARIQVARCHEKVANARKDKLHKLTTDLVRRFDVLAIEDLSTSTMLKNRHLAKSISEVSWSEFQRQLAYKCDWYGKTLHVVDPKHTSQRCHSCGSIHALNRKEQAVFACVSCGHQAHADTNGALNILARAQGVW